MLAEDDMAGLLAAQTVAVLGHILVHIFVTDCGLLVGDAFPVKCLVKAEVGHDGGNYRVVAQGTNLLHVLAADVENQITVYHAAVLIYRDTAVCITVVSKAYVTAGFLYILLQDMDVGGATVGVDVQTVRMVVDDMGLCSQSIEYVLGNSGSAAVSAVQSHFFALEGTGGNGDQVTDVAVSACGVVGGAADGIL